MFGLQLSGGTTNVILSPIIMFKRLQKIQLIRGLTFVGKVGGTLLFSVVLVVINQVAVRGCDRQKNSPFTTSITNRKRKTLQ